MQARRRIRLVAIGVGRRVAGSSSARQRIHRRDQRCGEARAADLEPPGLAFVFRGVVDRCTCIRVRISGNVGNAAFGAAFGRRPVRVGCLPAFGGDVRAATAPRARPDGLAAIGVARPEAQRRSAHSDHVRRGRRVFGSVAAVSRGDGGGDARMVVGGRVDAARLARELQAAVAVGDLRGAERRGGVDRRGEIAEVGRGCLDQQDLAVLADRMDGLDVERYLDRPTCVDFRIGAFLPVLVDLSKAAVRFGAGG